MRASIRLLATAQRAGSSAYLTPFAPTGLTGVLTHPTPRPHLMYLYGATLDKLATLPEESAYRQSVEALTKHRLSIVEKQKPAGYDEWHKRVAEQIKSNPEIFGPSGDAVEAIANKQRYVIQSRTEAPDEREVEWDGDMAAERTEGPKAVADRVNQAQEFGAGRSVDEIRQTSVVIEEEPALTKDQITDIENQIGAGLIEEVVIVAERELALIDKMKEAAVWEELAEKPVEGQWSYFERGTHTGGTQAP